MINIIMKESRKKKNKIKYKIVNNSNLVEKIQLYKNVLYGQKNQSCYKEMKRYIVKIVKSITSL